MRKPALIAAAMVAIPTPAMAENWVLVSTSDDAWFFVDTDSKTSISFWTASLRFDVPDTSVSKVKFSVRCPAQEFRMTYIHTSDREQKVRQSESVNESWKPAIPGTHVGEIIEFACDPSRPNADDAATDDLFTLWEDKTRGRE